MWEKSDFEFEFQRLNEDIDLLKTWLQERRLNDLEQGLDRLERVVERLDSKVAERFDRQMSAPLDLEGLIGSEPPSLSGMMVMPGEEAKDGVPIPPSMLAALLTQLFEQDSDKSIDFGQAKEPGPRFDWPGPSDN